MGFVNKLLDRSVFFAFDRSGFERHARDFDDGELGRLAGRVCLVSGANSGLGLSLARGLAERGARVHMLCRSAERGEAARASIVASSGNDDVTLHIVDLSSLASVRRFAKSFAPQRIDALVHNAGALLDERVLTEDGLEVTTATHVVGPFLLTQLLRSKLRGGRVVFVSSGGMYTKRLDVGALRATTGRFDGVLAYAYAKRAQVVLAEQLAKQLGDDRICVSAMHPGWAATPGVERALPRFWRLMRGRLRTPEQGADTALWLCATERAREHSGALWFDRAVAPTHLLRRTRESQDERDALWAFCVEASGAGLTLP